MKRAKPLIIACVLLFVTGCSTLGYYSQSILGHNKIMWARKPLDRVISNADADLKQQLLTAQEIRRFAVERLTLPDNKSYTSYVDLQRDYPVWNVVAAPEFSLEAKAWCYPVIGCATYRGYFSEQAALDYALNLQAHGFETTVGGAIAYSTLGWFSDPLLSSMMRYDDANLAENLFHELAHQVAYVNGDSAFNEAFASVVGEQGALQWLNENRPELVDNYRHRLAVYNDFVNLLNNTKVHLESLYQQELPAPQKRQQKQEIIRQLHTNYDELKASHWQGGSYFDHWFDKPINNARLASVSTYREHMPPLQDLLEACEYNFDAYFATIKAFVKIASPELVIDNLPNQCSQLAIN